MKRRHCLRFSVPPELVERVGRRLAEIGSSDSSHPPSLEGGLHYVAQTLDGGDSRIDAIKERAGSMNLMHSERIEHSYSVTELRESPLLLVQVRRAEIEPYGPSYGTTYDLSSG